MSERQLHEDTQRIIQDVVARLDPRALVSDALSADRNPFPVEGRVVIVAVGKASVPMASGAIDALGDRVSGALAVTKAGLPLTVEPPEALEVIESDHPVPTERSLAAGHRVLETVRGLDESSLVIMLISGGGSALVEDLVEGVDLDDLRRATDHLLRAGATINELNAVRRRLSRIKGGRLARAIAPAKVLNLIVSDVLGNPLQDIASGPTVRPPSPDTTFQSVMAHHDLIDGLPEAVRRHLESAQEDHEPWPDNVLETEVLADAEAAARIAAETAGNLGYRVQTLGFDFQGEASEFGRTWATIARHVRTDESAFQLPVALIGSGELTVTVRGDGVGGRNTEMALAAAEVLDGLSGVAVTSFATDGDDGASDCAGGTVDGGTLTRIRDAEDDPSRALRENDSARALSAAGATIDIGSTGTNVNDLYLALVRRTED